MPIARVSSLLTECGGVIDVRGVDGVPRRALRRAVADGDLLKVGPSTYVGADDPTALRKAAVRSTGGVLSHRTALHAWGLESSPAPGPVHVTVSATRRLAPRGSVIVHRTRVPPPVVERDGLPVVALERTLLDCWPVSSAQDARAAVIHAVRERRTTVSRIRAAVVARGSVPGAAPMSHLLGLLEAGCHSELEIWGLQRVLLIPGLPRAEHQIRVSAAGRTVYLDAGWSDARLAVEFDGAATHGDGFREADLRRDSWLAALGWLVIRVSYRRVMDDPTGVRRELAMAYEIRRVQLPTR